MNRFALLLAGCAVLGVAACDHPDAARQRAEKQPKAVAKLNCPERQGQLKRVATTADGMSCVYTADGAEVTLKLVALNGGSADAALQPIEAELKALMPATPAKAGVNVNVTAKAAAPAGKGEEVDINLPGLSIQASDSGAQIKAGGAEITATDDVAEVRVVTDKNGYASRYLVANEAGAPWKVVGYEARGPKNGPLAVATLKKSGDGGETDGLFSDISALLKHNVGGTGVRGMHVDAN
ncbi:MAG: hypothetical protein KA105_01010 [Caulobacter sp.]|nr:hypothetical protein [Caulobacter sp.]